MSDEKKDTPINPPAEGPAATAAPSEKPEVPKEEISGNETNSAVPPEKEAAAKAAGQDLKEEGAAAGQAHALVDVNELALTVSNMYNKDKVDLETIEMDEVMKLLRTSLEGLTTQEAESRIEKVKISHIVIRSLLTFSLAIIASNPTSKTPFFSSCRSCGTPSHGSWKVLRS